LLYSLRDASMDFIYFDIIPFPVTHPPLPIQTQLMLQHVYEPPVTFPFFVSSSPHSNTLYNSYKDVHEGPYIE
jgi:hypothetical protein